MKQRWLNEEDAVERMDGWMDEESRQGKALRMKNLRAAAKRMRIRLDDEGREKEPAQGVADGVLIL